MIAYIGLGSNLDNPELQVRQAFTELDELPDTRVASRSSLYRSAPMGPPDQPDYINAVAGLDTALPAQRLLDDLLAIEATHRRVRAQHWGPRTLDLDVLIYADHRIDTPRLRVPHPHLHERAFVLVPLFEIAPTLSIPGLGTLEDLVNQIDDATVKRLA